MRRHRRRSLHRRPPPRCRRAPDAERDVVLAVQAALDRAAFSVGEIDDRMGANTERALRAFQRTHDLAPSRCGRPGDDTRTRPCTASEITADAIRGRAMAYPAAVSGRRVPSLFRRQWLGRRPPKARPRVVGHQEGRTRDFDRAPTRRAFGGHRAAGDPLEVRERSAAVRARRKHGGSHRAPSTSGSGEDGSAVRAARSPCVRAVRGRTTKLRGP